MVDAPDKEPDEHGKALEVASKIDTGNPLSGISRTITDQELSESSGARKLLLYAYDKLELECIRLRSEVSRLHGCEKTLAANEVLIENYGKMSNVGDLCKVVGGAILGFAANNINKHQWLIVGVLAFILIVGPFVYHNYNKRTKRES